MIEKYQQFVRDSAYYPETATVQYLGIALAGESGEVCNEIKKLIRDDKNEMTTERLGKIIDECGDILWYLTALSDQLGFTLPYLMKQNMEKFINKKNEKRTKNV